MTSHSNDNPPPSALFTDLYQLTMAAAYEAEGMRERAVFELFFRELPPTRQYVMAAGLPDVVAFLESFEIGQEETEYLAAQDMFSVEFLQSLRQLRFTGDVDAVAEGTVVFPNEPLLRVTAPIVEAQLVETLILNQVHFQSVAATKAARVVLAAEGRNVVDFGSRRAHGTDAALKVARGSYLAGAAGSSNVLAGKQFDLPIFGTMAHSYVQAHDDEAEAFAEFARVHPRTTILVDTYDTLEGVHKLIQLSRQQGDAFQVQAIRLDSGDLAELSRQARRLLDEAGLPDVRIFASSGLDEYKVAALVERKAPIDGFGVGTSMAVSEDAPSLDMAYKLVEYAGRPRTKLSSHKVIYPGPKQVFRHLEQGEMRRDTIGRADERLEGTPLLFPVMRQGKRLSGQPADLETARQHARRQLEMLPPSCRRLEADEAHYEVRVSPAVQADLEAIRRQAGREN